MSRLNKLYPFIGDDATTPTRVDFGNINAGALTTPTATVSSATAVTAGLGIIQITINGNNRNLLTVLD